jgi:hypothetical protein
VDGFGDDYVHSARELLRVYVEEPDELAPDALKPYQNAENIAAAATGKLLESHSRRREDVELIVSPEHYFTKNCGFTEINL